MNNAARTTDTTTERRRQAPAHHRPRPTPDNDNVPQPARIVTKSAVIRHNITADSLNAVADWGYDSADKILSRSSRHVKFRLQACAGKLRALAREVEAERGW